ncbi:unnamed protein product [Caenorhabditis brenneri]
MPSLLDMTDVPMTNIMEWCDMKSVMILRKVCHSLRNFIDDSKLKIGLDHFHIGSSSGRVKIEYGIEKDETIEKSYKLRNVPMEDLRLIFNLQNSKMSKFVVAIDPYQKGVLADLEAILKARPRPLQVETFQQSKSNLLQIHLLLPYFDSKSIKKIIMSREKAPHLVDGEEAFLNSEHFKNAEDLRVFELIFNKPLERFMHLKSFALSIQGFSIQDIVFLKKALKKPDTHNRQFKILNSRLTDHELREEFGVPLYSAKGWKDWYFKTPNHPDHVLRMRVEFGALTLRRVRRSDKLTDDLIRN